MKNRKAVLDEGILKCLLVAVAGQKKAVLLKLYEKAVTSNLIKSLGGRTGDGISMFAVQKQSSYVNNYACPT